MVQNYQFRRFLNIYKMVNMLNGSKQNEIITLLTQNYSILSIILQYAMDALL